MAYTPITTKEQVDALDQDLMVKGYQAGYENIPDYTQRDQSYWHGYLNGQVDGKHVTHASEEQRQLARDIVNKSRAH